jgi:hypothetical protein
VTAGFETGKFEEERSFVVPQSSVQPFYHDQESFLSQVSRKILK